MINIVKGQTKGEMMKFIIIFIIALMLAGCEGYKFGDASKLVIKVGTELHALHVAHCDPANAARKEILLAEIRLIEPDYPENGNLCATEK